MLPLAEEGRQRWASFQRCALGEYLAEPPKQMHPHGHIPIKKTLRQKQFYRFLKVRLI